MSRQQYNNVQPSYGIDDQVRINVNSSANGQNRPKSAPKRPSSANAYTRSSVNPSRAPAKIRQAVAGSSNPLRKLDSGLEEQVEYWRGLNREDLLFELQETKKCFIDTNSKMLRLQSENMRWEKELGKQQQRIDKLLEMIAHGPSDTKSGPNRKDGDKSLLVRQLKLQILGLRDNIASRDAEIEALNKGQKATHLLELLTEKDEYYHEIIRLQKVVKELKDELAVIKQRREWSSNLITPDDIDIRSEFLKLASSGGFSMMNANANVQKPQRPISGGRKRPTSAKGSSQQQNQQQHNQQQQQQQQQVEEQNWQQHRQQVASNQRDDSRAGKSNNSSQALSHFDQQTSQYHNEELRDNNPFQTTAGSAVASVAHEQGNDVISAVPPTTPQRTQAEIKSPRLLPSESQMRADATATIIQSSPAAKPSKMEEISNLYAVGDVVEGHFREYDGWYRAKITAITGNDIYNLEYDDGDKESNVAAVNIRLPPLGCVSPVKPPIGSAPSMAPRSVTPAGVGVNVTGTPLPLSGSAGLFSNAIITSGKYQVGDSIEALYYNGKSWYSAKIKSVRIVNDKFVYDVNYDDGEAEKGVIEVNIRRKGDDLGQPENLSSSAGNTLVKIATDKQANSLSVNGNKTNIDAVAPTSAEKIASKPVDPSLPRNIVNEALSHTSTPRIQSVPHTPRMPVYDLKVGDVVEGRYGNGHIWFGATVQNITRLEKPEWCDDKLQSSMRSPSSVISFVYDLQYEDGDTEAQVSRMNVRRKGDIRDTGSLIVGQEIHAKVSALIGLRLVDEDSNVFPANVVEKISPRSSSDQKGEVVVVEFDLGKSLNIVELREALANSSESARNESQKKHNSTFIDTGANIFLRETIPRNYVLAHYHSPAAPQQSSSHVDGASATPSRSAITPIATAAAAAPVHAHVHVATHPHHSPATTAAVTEEVQAPKVVEQLETSHLRDIQVASAGDAENTVLNDEEELAEEVGDDPENNFNENLTDEVESETNVANYDDDFD